MLVYTLRRLLMVIPILLAASLLTFLLIEAVGDPVQDFIFNQTQSTGEPPSDQAIDNFKAYMYLDRPLAERYWLWLTGIGSTNGDIGLLQGKWGPSIRSSQHDIGEHLTGRFFITVRLVLIATLMSIGLAIITGVISAVKQYRMTDYALTFVGFLALAMPTFWFAVLIKNAAVWSNSNVGTNFRTIGSESRYTAQMSFLERMGDWGAHLILPTIVLMLTGYAAASRFQRSAMLDVLNSDYVRLARAKGLRNRVVMRRHALRTALIPIATFAPLGIAFAFSGSIIIEVIFNWHGLGRYFLEAIQRNDSFAVLGFLIIAGTLVVLANLVADLLYGVLDPRIRYE